MNQQEDKTAANIQHINTQENQIQQNGQVQYEDQEQTKTQCPPGEQYQPLENYVISKTLGKGNFGKVKLATHKLTGQLVAVKILQKQLIFQKSDIVRISRQLKIMKLIRHPFVIQLYQIIETPKQLYLIMEYAQNGDLFDKIVKLERFNEDLASKFYAQIALGLQYLHDMGVTHRDLKPQNILIDKNNVVKIADFGLGNMFKIGQKLKTACGSPCYASPQMLNKEQYDPKKIDIWSSGIILYAMVCGYLPFQDKVTSKLYEKIKSSSYKLPSWVSNQCRNLIRGILTKDPSLRWDIQVILQHEFLVKQVNNLTQAVQKKEINQEKLKQVCQKYGIQQQDRLISSLKKNKHSNLTTLYYLGLRSIQKEKSNSTKNSIFKQFQQILDIQQQRAQTQKLQQQQKAQTQKLQQYQRVQAQQLQKRQQNHQLKAEPLELMQQIKQNVKMEIQESNSGHNIQNIQVSSNNLNNQNNQNNQMTEEIDNASKISPQFDKNNEQINNQHLQQSLYQGQIQKQNQLDDNNAGDQDERQKQKKFKIGHHIQRKDISAQNKGQSNSQSHPKTQQSFNTNNQSELCNQKQKDCKCQKSVQKYNDKIQLEQKNGYNTQLKNIENLVQEDQNDINAFPQTEFDEQINNSHLYHNSNLQKNAQQIKSKEQKLKKPNKTVQNFTSSQVSIKALKKGQAKKTQTFQNVQKRSINSSNRLKKSERIRQYKPQSHKQDLSNLKLYERSHSKDRPIALKSKMNQKFEHLKNANQEKASKLNNKSLNDSYASISPSSTPKYKKQQIQKYKYSSKLSNISQSESIKKLMISGKQIETEPYLINPQKLILCDYESLCKVLDSNGFIGKFQYFNYQNQCIYLAKSNLKLSTKAIQKGKKTTLQKVIEQINNQFNF